MILIFLMFVLPFLSVLISPFRPKISYYSGLIISALVVLISALFVAGKITVNSYSAGYFKIHFGQLNATFEIIISVTFFLVYLFSLYYMPEDRKLAFFINLTVFSISSVLLSKNVILFLLFWESMSISGYLLIGFKKDTKSYPPFVFLVFGELSTLFLTAGFAAYFVQTGSLSLTHSFSNPYILIVIILGFLFKMGMVPLQMVEWLPIAHGNAPTSGSILFSASMTTLALYGILTFSILAKPDLIIGLLLMIFGSFSLLFGSLFALSSENSKMLPAYSTVENSGAMILLTGILISWRYYGNFYVYTFTLLGIFIYATAHAWAKSTIFILSGISDHHEIGSVKKSYLSRHSRFLSGIGLISLMGLIPIGGGIGEWFLLESLFISASAVNLKLFSTVAIISGSLAALGAGVTIPTFTKYYYFMAGRMEKDRNLSRINFPVAAGGALVLSISILIPAFIYLYSGVAGKILGLPQSIIYLSTLKDIPYPFLIYSPAISGGFFGFVSPIFDLLFISITALIVSIFAGRNRRPIPMWNGGIEQGENMNSFAYSNVLRIVLKKVYNSKEERRNGKYSERTFDIFWVSIVDMTILFQKFSIKFGRFFMNGNINRYIAYIIIAFFAVLIFVSIF